MLQRVSVSVMVDFFVGCVLEFLSKMMDFKVFGGSVLGCLLLFLRGGGGRV